MAVLFLTVVLSLTHSESFIVIFLNRSARLIFFAAEALELVDYLSHLAWDSVTRRKVLFYICNGAGRLYPVS